MVSRIEPDRYADTGFAVNDTTPEVNAMIFAAMMRKTPEQRLLMGFDMMATARELVWGEPSPAHVAAVYDYFSPARKVVSIRGYWRSGGSFASTLIECRYKTNLPH